MNRAQQAANPSPGQGSPQQQAPAAGPTGPAATPKAPPASQDPAWPANNKPSPATVVWDSQGLRIQANNSSLDQILHDVAADTGATVDGMSQDERIFGEYGPGPARDVLSQILDGSAYNMIMIGDSGHGTPRQILLSSRTPGTAKSDAAHGGNTNEDSEVEEPPEPQPEPVQEQPQPQPQPQPIQNPFGGGMPPRSPQEIMQQMQQRQQQMQQQLQQQQQQQQQQ
jgi:hypothetical protein